MSDLHRFLSDLAVGAAIAIVASLIAATIALILIAVGILVDPARAHEWYPPACCSDRDCAPVDPAFVEEVAGGYRFRIPAGRHPMLPAGGPGFDVTVPHRDIRPAPDGRFHICISPSRQLLCTFGAAGGV